MKKTSLLCISSLLLCVIGLAFAQDSLTVSREGDTGFYTVDWPYEASATGEASAVCNRVYGRLFRVYHEPASGHEMENTWSLTVREGFGYQPSVYTDDIADGAISGDSTTATLKVWPLWPASDVPVSSKLHLRLTGALTGSGDGAEGRFIFVVSPLGD